VRLSIYLCSPPIYSILWATSHIVQKILSLNHIMPGDAFCISLLQVCHKPWKKEVYCIYMKYNRASWVGPGRTTVVIETIGKGQKPAALWCAENLLAHSVLLCCARGSLVDCCAHEQSQPHPTRLFSVSCCVKERKRGGNLYGD